MPLTKAETLITSTRNTKIQHVRSLLKDRKERARQRAFVIEGVRLVEEAVTAGCQPDFVLISSTLGVRGGQLAQDMHTRGILVEEVEDRVLASISATENSQGILAVVPWLDVRLTGSIDFVILADGLRDPGNLGTILRTAAATGVQAVFLSPDSVDLYNPKVVRAGMGAHFRIPTFQVSWAEIKSTLKPAAGSTIKIIEANVSASKTLWEIDLKQPVCLMISSESEGTSIEGSHLSDDQIKIPMPGGTESLNASVAAAVLMVEVLRQRQTQE